MHEEGWYRFARSFEAFFPYLMLVLLMVVVSALVLAIIRKGVRADIKKHEMPELISQRLAEVEMENKLLEYDKDLFYARMVDAEAKLKMLKIKMA